MSAAEAMIFGDDGLSARIYTMIGLWQDPGGTPSEAASWLHANGYEEIELSELERAVVRARKRIEADHEEWKRRDRHRRATLPVTRADGTPIHLPVPIDWTAFWSGEEVGPQWLVEQVLPLGRQVAVYAKHKQGKSLLLGDTAGALSSGRSALGQEPTEPIDVIYCDYEMTQQDVRERLTDLGYSADDDLSRLHYYLLPTLPPLDTDEGGECMAALVQRDNAKLVILDTTSRIVAGGENDADTFRALYRCTGSRLKALGVTLVRLDHAGKDMGQGQRGSSAKGDDVDLVWELRDTGGGELVLKRIASRIAWVPESVTITRQTDPLRHVARTPTKGFPAGTKGCADHLDSLGAPLTITVDTAVDMLREAGQSRRREVVSAAIRYRRERHEREAAASLVADLVPGTARGTDPGTTRGTAGNQQASALVTAPELPAELPGTAGTDRLGTAGVPLWEPRVPAENERTSEPHEGSAS